MRLNIDLKEYSLDEGLVEELLNGWIIREKNFNGNITFHSPGFKHYEVDDFSIKGGPKFVDISITGKNCELMCDHCASKILWHMIPATTPEELWNVATNLKNKGVDGVLISGGSDKDGIVQMDNFFDVMSRIKKELGMLLTCHVGLVNHHIAESLSKCGVDAVLIDVIGNNETIANVYKLPHKTVEDYAKSLEILKEFNHNIVPHVIIGLHYGKILGEYSAIDLISQFNPSALVLVVIMPYFGKSRFQLLPPPKTEECAKLVLYARLKLPYTPVVIGCARPAGSDRFKFDLYSLLAGVNAITFPSEGIFSIAKELGLSPKVSPNCCSTIFMF
ncbi:MAG: radical SAM protein [Aquificaceae bacterium]|nr:radical SAM protein [Aquificaceae bacterium]